MTICPARVPVMVELCPAAISAIANKVGASLLPKKSLSSSYAVLISATSVLPRKKNTEAARTSIAAFTKRFKAMVLSMRFNFNARLIPLLSFLNFRVCTKAECKYKLCGITVAPIIPMAIYNASCPGMCGTKPLAT